MILLALLSGCILGPRPESCSANSDCRDAFGFGSVCGDDGYCAPVAANARCDTTWPEDLFRNPQNYNDHLVIGSIFNMPFDEPQRLSAELAVRNAWDAEETSGVYGRYVAIVHCDNAENIDIDDLDSVEAAAASAKYLVDDLGIQAIIGPSTSDESFAVFDAASPGGAITISPSATSPSLTPVGGFPSEQSPGLFWRTAPPDDLQAFAIAQDLLDRGAESIAILYEESSYASSLADAVQANFEGGGRTVVTYSYADGTALAQLIPRTFNEGADEVVYFTGESADVVTFLDTASVTPENVGVPIFLADAAADTAIFDVAGGSAMLPYVRGSRPQVPEGQRFDDFSITYNAEYGASPDESVFTSYSFDASWLALYGAMWADIEGEPVTGETIGRGILRLSSGDDLDIGYFTLGQVRSAFEAGNPVNIEGASGSLDFDSQTGEVSNPIEVWVVDADAETFVPVKVCEPGGTCEALPGAKTTTTK
jgi:branched-chain amino acid transport system substrate-binding protein